MNRVHVSCFTAFSVSLSFPANNASTMADVILIKSEKNSSLNLLEHYNVINCRTTAKNLHVEMHVARIARDKTYFSVKSTLSLLLSFSGRSNFSGEIFIRAEMSKIYIQ